MPGAGHSPHRDAPEATRELLFEWLDREERHMERRLISSGSTFEEQIGYSRAVVAGDWVFVSGTTGFDYSTMTIVDDMRRVRPRNACATSAPR